MIVKTKERKEIFFKDVKVGQVFREYNNEEDVYMKVNLEDDYIVCPRCDEDIRINDEKGMAYAVDLASGLVYDFEPQTTVEIIQGYFIEE